MLDNDMIKAIAAERHRTLAVLASISTAARRTVFDPTDIAAIRTCQCAKRHRMAAASSASAATPIGFRGIHRRHVHADGGVRMHVSRRAGSRLRCGRAVDISILVASDMSVAPKGPECSQGRAVTCSGVEAAAPPQVR